MAKPTLLLDNLAKKVLSLVIPGPGVRYPMGVGTKDVGYDEDAAWLAAASHEEGDTFASGDPASVVGGVTDAPGTGVVVPLRVDAAGRVIAVTKPSTGSLTNRSGAITAGGTRQAVAAALADRRYFFFQNISDTTMWINFGVNAVADQPSIQILAGGSFVMEAGFVSAESVDVMCATTGKKYVAKEA